FGVQATYTQGAIGYVTGAFNPMIYGSGPSVGVGWATDGTFFSPASSVQLTTAFSIYARFQHQWNPKWKSSLYGGYLEVDYNSTVTTFMCPVGGLTGSPISTPFTGAATKCSPDFSLWQVGTRTQWNPHPDLDIGVDVIWSHLNTAFAGTASLAANG